MQDGISSDAWLELRLPADAVDEEAFARLCESLGAAGRALETRAKTGDAEQVAWFPLSAPSGAESGAESGADEQAARARIAAAVALTGVDASAMRLTRLQDDWATAWQRDWKAMPVGERLWVRPSFCEPAPAGRLDIVLEPGMAFGTGSHPTTRLCLEAIERICAGPNPPRTMLDMGAGSGILAIAAARLGVRRVLAVDNDPDALDACRANAAANAVRVDCRLGDAPPAGTFDLVVANILAGPLADMAPALAAATGRRLALSGILADQAGRVIAAYERQGLSCRRTERMEDWVCLEMERA